MSWSDARLRLRYYGHASFGLWWGDDSLLFDPYRPGGFGGSMDLPPIEERFARVVVTHDHDDHAALDALKHPAPRVHSGQHGCFLISRVGVFHDEYRGRRRGGESDVVIVEVGGRRIVHLGDVGHSPRPNDLRSLGDDQRIDVLIVPVGGYFTIGAAQAWEWCRALSPGWVIPAHGADPRVGLPLRPIAHFLASSTWPVQRSAEIVEYEEGLLSFKNRVVVMGATAESGG